MHGFKIVFLTSIRRLKYIEARQLKRYSVYGDLTGGTLVPHHYCTVTILAYKRQLHVQVAVSLLQLTLRGGDIFEQA